MTRPKNRLTVRSSWPPCIPLPTLRVPSPHAQPGGGDMDVENTHRLALKIIGRCLGQPRPGGPRHRLAGGGVYGLMPCHRIDLGAADLGDVVAVGRTGPWCSVFHQTTE
jgi:hypothetical protein